MRVTAFKYDTIFYETTCTTELKASSKCDGDLKFGQNKLGLYKNFAHNVESLLLAHFGTASTTMQYCCLFSFLFPVSVIGVIQVIQLVPILILYCFRYITFSEAHSLVFLSFGKPKDQCHILRDNSVAPNKFGGHKVTH